MGCMTFTVTSDLSRMSDEKSGTMKIAKIKNVPTRNSEPSDGLEH